MAETVLGDLKGKNKKIKKKLLRWSQKFNLRASVAWALSGAVSAGCDCGQRLNLDLSTLSVLVATSCLGSKSTSAIGAGVALQGVAGCEQLGCKQHRGDEIH